MPYRNPDQARRYFREYRRARRGGESSTPCSTRVPLEFRLETAADAIALLEDQCKAVLDDADASTLEKARTIGYLVGISLRAIEAGNIAGRLEAIEAALAARKEKP